MPLNKMASLLLSLIVAAVFIFSPTTGQPVQPTSWKLKLLWPNSFCHNKDVKCIASIPQNAFVIGSLVGIDQFDLKEMTCDGPQPPLDPAKMADVKDLLPQYWPDLEGDNFGLWQRQWQTYAACYGIDPAYYFIGAIGLKLDTDRQIVKGFGGISFQGEQVFGALSRQGVVPGQTYLFTYFADRVSKKYGQRLEAMCNFDAAGVSQFLEFHMCAVARTYKFHLINCPIEKTYECLKNVRFT